MTKANIIVRKFMSLTEFAKVAIAKGLGIEFKAFSTLEETKTFFKTIRDKNLIDELYNHLEIYTED